MYSKIELLIVAFIVLAFIIYIYRECYVVFEMQKCEGYLHNKYKELFVLQPSFFFTIKSVVFHEFVKYIILIPICSNSVYNRNIIRSTWGDVAVKLKYRIIFYMGNNYMIKENKYNDIIQFSFKDSYFNLTISTLLIYNWTNNIIKKFDYIMKIDSDVYPNIQLINMYTSIYVTRNKIYGYYYPKMKSNRNISNSNFLPREIYQPSTLPEFVAGNFYILPKLNNWKLYINSFNLSSVNLIYREDIQFGLYLKKFKVKIKNINSYYKRRSTFSKCKDIKMSFAVHGIKSFDYAYIYFNCLKLNYYI